MHIVTITMPMHVVFNLEIIENLSPNQIRVNYQLSQFKSAELQYINIDTLRSALTDGLNNRNTPNHSLTQNAAAPNQNSPSTRRVLKTAPPNAHQ